MDRISSLPINIIEDILSFMTLRGATRTSILSSTWRYMWASCPVVKLNRQFYNRNFRKLNTRICKRKFRKKPCEHLVDSVDRILSLHIGPIIKFVVYIPSFSETDDISPDVDRWIHSVLSKNTLKRLTIFSSFDHRYKLPDCVFDTSELTCLWLTDCIVEPPCGFRGFHNLTILKLLGISFLSNNTFEVLLPSARFLKELFFRNCIGTVNLTVDAPCLQSLFVRCKTDLVFVLGLFGGTPSLKYAHLAGKNTLDNSEHGNAANLAKLLSSMPQVTSLVISGSNLKLMASGTVPRLLATPLNLTKLEIYLFKDLDEISSILCLLRNSPRLRSLLMLCSENRPTRSRAEEVEYLDSPTCLVNPLGQLQTVELFYINVFSVVMPVFIKLLLAKTPLLKKMKIGLTKGTDAVEASRFSAEIMGFPLASSIPAAELFAIGEYSPG